VSIRFDLTDHDQRPPADECVHRNGEYMRVLFAETCERLDLSGELVGPADRLQIDFSALGADRARLVLDGFVGALRLHGVAASPVMCPPHVRPRDMAVVLTAIESALVFASKVQKQENIHRGLGLWGAFADRAHGGLEWFHSPWNGPTRVERADGLIRLSFAPGPIGGDGLAGFCLPTPLIADFIARVRYRIRAWAPEKQGWLILCAQDENASAHYWVQRGTWRYGQSDAVVVAGGCDRCRDLYGDQPDLADKLHPSERSLRSTEFPVSDREGELALTREGDDFTARHRGADGWKEVGRMPGGSIPDDLLIGVCLWSSASTDGIDVELTDFSVDADR
jgi:hypothetical protein